MRTLRVLFLALLLLASPLLQVARCHLNSEDPANTVEDAVEESGEVGVVGDDEQDAVDVALSSAPGIETVCVFPKNSAKLVPTGEETEILVGLKNDGQSSIGVIGIKASLHLPFDHQLLVQNLTMLSFNNASVPTSVQATFPYIFAVSKFLQAGTFDLVGTIIYEVDEQPYQSVFYNGTIEVVESGGLFSGESVFLVTLGSALLILLGLWVYSQVQRLTKKTKKTAKVEVGTRGTDASLDEWLEGTPLAKSSSSSGKSKKKKI